MFPQILFHYQQNFSMFARDALCRSRKTLCWSVWDLQAGCVSVCLRRSKSL